MNPRSTLMNAACALVLGLCSAAQAAVLSLTDGASSPAAKTYAFTIAEPGTFLASLSDLGFPERFDFLSLAVTPKGGASTLGSILAPGAFSFEASTAGDYVALVAARPGSATGFGFYSINIIAMSPSPVPEPQAWMLMVAGIGLIGWMRLRREVG
jgi:hypothetical protein